MFEEWSEGDFLRYRRRALGLTQIELSELSGVPQSHISAAERGRKPLSEAEAQRIGAHIMKRPSEMWAAHKNQVVLVLGKYGLVDVAVFGSVATGRDTPSSDLDLVASGSISYFEKVRLEAELETLLGTPVDLAVDSGRNTPVWNSIRAQAVPA